MNIHLPAILIYFDVHQGYKVLTHCHMLILFQPFFWLWKCFPIFPPRRKLRWEVAGPSQLKGLGSEPWLPLICDERPVS